jgi:peptidoglycan/LPS O-acetylase OafA/YrhL
MQAVATQTVTNHPASASERDLVLDLVRAGALGVVVLWHWVFSTVAFPNGPTVGNPVGTTPGLWALTWILQPMPVFFAVGGCLHARSFDGRVVAFWTRRIRRLVLPALPLLIPAAVAIIVADAIDRPDIVRTLVLLISPMWFLAVYLVLVLIAPFAIRAHRRAPVLTFAVLAAAAVAVDVARFGFGWSGPLMVVASFLAMWALVHQFGFVLDDLRRASMTTKVAVAIAGLGGLATLVSFGPYPAAMVGVPGEPVSNMGPPTLAPVFLGLMQIGVLAALSTQLQAFAQRHRTALASVGTWTMPVFVWHLLAWAIFYAVLRATGTPVLSEPNADWWAQRPLWLIGPLLVTIPLCRLAMGGRAKLETAQTGTVG